MSFWDKLIGKKKNTKSIVVYERENKKLWDYVRLLTELLEEKDKEIKSLNTEIKRFEETKVPVLKKTQDVKKPAVKISTNKKEKITQKSKQSKSEDLVEKKIVKTKEKDKKSAVSKPKVSQEKTTSSVKQTKNTNSKPKKIKDKEINNEDTILNFIKTKKVFYDYKGISEGTNLPESIVRTMISRLKKRGINLEEKKDGKRKLIKFVK